MIHEGIAAEDATSKVDPPQLPVVTNCVIRIPSPEQACASGHVRAEQVLLGPCGSTGAEGEELGVTDAGVDAEFPNDVVREPSGWRCG